MCIYFDYVIRGGPYPQVQVRLYKKKSFKESQYIVSHPGLSSDPPIGSDRESGCDSYDVTTCLSDIVTP